MPKPYCLFLLLVASALQAQPAFLVKDIRTGELPAEWPGSPSFVSLGGTVYFSAFDRIHGTELWRSDGTPGGTSLVRDVCPGICSSNPAELTVAGGSVHFRADDGAHGPALWKSDGTAAGTVLVKDVEPLRLAEVDGLIAFAATTTDQGQELWRSDGTAAGTFSLGDLRPGVSGSNPHPLGSTGGALLFWADDGMHGAELWKTDGTAAGTDLVEDLTPGPGGAMPLPQEAKASPAVGGRLLFWATDGNTPGYQLWASDGTPAGTARIGNVSGGGTEFSSGTLAGAVYFQAFEASQGGGLWKSDGTAVGTVLVKELSSALYEPTVAGDLVFFRLEISFISTIGELWLSNGTEAGTGPVPLPPGLDVQNHLSTVLAVLGDELVFRGYSNFDSRVWKTDGTEAGTIELGTVGPGPGVATGAVVLFQAFNLDDRELWKTDGTPAGTQIVKRIDQSDASGLTPEAASVPWFPTLPAKAGLNGALLFAADDGSTGSELWRSDGSAAGTWLLKELNPSGSGLPYGLTPFGGRIYFTGNLFELWASDGTEAGTASFPSGCNYLTPAGSQLFCVAAGLGDILRKIGPADPDTTMVKFFYPGILESLTAVGPRLFFTALEEGERELWTSDGTEAGTQRVLDIAPGVASSLPGDLTAHLGNLYFSADDEGAAGRELWKSDGTSGGTVRVKDILPGPGSSDPREITSAGGLLFFVADDGASGAELWRSNGSSAGTVRVKDIRPGSGSSFIQWITAHGNRVFFAADDGVHGQELWVSDGTEGGTYLVEDIVPGAVSSYPRYLESEGHVLLFAAEDDTHGLEPWRSDGTAAGTFMIQDVAPGTAASTPTGYVLSGDHLFFTANDGGAHGFELWALDRTVLGSMLAATKRVMSPTYPGGSVVYEIVITNIGAGPHPDLSGDEMGDTLPAGLTLTGASADAGTATADLPNNRVAWNGALDPGESATVTVEATLSPAAVVYSMIFNQATVRYDSDGDGTSEKTGVSSDPGRGPEEPTLATVSTPPLDFHTVTPCRVLDTRTSSPFASGVKQTFAIAGTCGVPATARAVAANVTALSATGTGDFVLHPAGIPHSVPVTSTVSFPATRARANNAELPLASGSVDATATVAGGGTVHLLLDVTGYFE